MGITRRGLLQYLGLAPAAAVLKQTERRDLTPDAAKLTEGELRTEEYRRELPRGSWCTASSWVDIEK